MGEKVLALPRRRELDIARLAPSGRTLAIVAACVLVAFGVYAIARGTALFHVAGIRVDGASPELASQVRSELRRYEGESLVRIDTAAVEQRVDGLPTVRASEVDRSFPHTLRVRVVPEVPVAVLRRGAQSWLVSARGRVIGEIQLGTRRALPRIWLPARTDIEIGSLLTRDTGGLAARSLAAFVRSGFRARITFVRALDGQITLGLRGGLEIQLGPPVDLPLKIAIVHGILPTLALPAQGGPDYLDLTVPERPVAGRNSQPSA